MTKVSCLAASLFFQLPLVLAGTSEGTVFAFQLEHQSPFSNSERDGEGEIGGGGGGVGANGTAGVLVQRSDGTTGKTELGVVLMKFEHTRDPIDAVSCSREEV